MRRLWSHPLKAGVLTALGAMAALRGCDCGGPGTGLSDVPPFSCEDEGRRPNEEDSPCDSGQRFIKGKCEPERCDAESSADWVPDCCPGTVCTAGGVCQVRPSQVVLCEDDSNCDVPGQHCLERARVSTESKTCGFLPPATGGGCPEGGNVFNGRCVLEAPCGGSCPVGSVCNIDTNTCEGPPTQAPEAPSDGCHAECGPAQILVYEDPDAMLFDQCCEITCVCETLPELTPGAWGRYSDMVLTADSIYVSGYDSTYGDLVLGRHGKLSTELDELEYIDGVPSVGDVVADPEGPRGGRKDSGSDVGTHTALALHNGLPRIAYYDLETQDLKYASFDGTSWTLSLIDDGRDATDENTGDVGRYTSLVIDSDGIAHVTYYAHRAAPDGVMMTGPMYARAKNAAPDSYEDWDRVAIEEVRSCDNACGDSQACVAMAGVPTCLDTTVGCAACGCGESCVQTPGGAACRALLPERLDQPCGGDCDSGFTCVDDDGQETCKPELEAGCGGCAEGFTCVDDGDGVTQDPACKLATPYSTIQGVPDGVGLFTSLVLDGDAPLVVYYDRLRHHLRGAVASFDNDSAVSGGFAPAPVACSADEDFGQHPALIIVPGGVAVAFQGDDGKTLWMCTGDDLDDCGQNVELVDDGLREASDSHVGAYASIAYDAGDDQFYIAYADQTMNDLLLSYGTPGAFSQTTLLSEGAFGSFAELLLDGDNGYASTLQVHRDAFNRDDSRIVVHAFSLSELP